MSGESLSSTTFMKKQKAIKAIKSIYKNIAIKSYILLWRWKNVIDERTEDDTRRQKK